MSINRKSLIQHQYNDLLMRSAPTKLKLIRAKAYNCVGGSCFQNDRKSISAFCSVCGGTGYIGGHLTDDMTKGIYATTYFIYCDLQIGHGLYGSGGDYIRLIGDLGKQDIGDATAYTKMWDYDAVTGKVIYPQVDPTFARPDQIYSMYGIIYNITKQLVVTIGNDEICRISTCVQNSYESAGGR